MLTLENAGKYRISDLGYTLVHFDRDSDEWKRAAADAARRPTLFRELLDEYPEGLPSDATLRNDLLKRDFNPAAISDVVSILRNTLSLAGDDKPAYNEGVNATVQQSPREPDHLTQPKPADRQKETQQAAQISTPVGSEDGQVVFAHVRFDGTLRKEFVTSLKKYLDYLEATLQ